MAVKTRRIHYAWIVLVSCILLKLGLGGAVMCIAGNFVTPVVNELGCQVSQFTLLVSVEAAAMAVMYTTAAKILNKGKIGKIMGIAAAAEAVSIGMMGLFHSVWMFYIAGAIIGVGVAFTGYVAIPIVVNMWFRRKAGTMLGIIIAAEGLSTVLFTLFTAQTIVRWGWRWSYGIMAVICLVISVPPLFLFIKSPQEVGCEPYGAGESENEVQQEIPGEGLTKKQAIRHPVFYMAWLTCMMYSVGCGVQQYIANFATMELGKSVPYGATAAMCMSIGCVASSMILGYINDRFGVKAGLAWGALFILLGYGGMIYSIQQPDFVIPAAFLVGLGGSMYTVQCPLLVRTVLGSREYSSIWSIMMTGNSLIGAFSFSPIGLFYDLGGSYRGAFIMAIVLYLLALAIGSISLDLGKRIQR